MSLSNNIITIDKEDFDLIVYKKGEFAEASFYSNFLSDEAIYALDKINDKSGRSLLKIHSRLDILDL